MKEKIKKWLKKHKCIKNCAYRFFNLRIVQFIRFRGWMCDKRYVTHVYKKRFGVKLNLDNPKTFNEKNNWRKLNDRKDIYTKMVDKYLFKEVVKERVGEDATFRLLGVWDNPKDIDFDSLPDKFVLKANHAGGVIVCRDKSTFDKKQAIKELKVDLKTNYFIRSREYPYKNVQRKIVAEEYMGEDLIDYKNYCFNGRVEYTLVWKNQSRKDGRKPKAYFCGAYDRKWNKCDLSIDYPTLDENADKPQCYEKMVEMAEKMSKDIPFVRTDCYIINDKVYLGEMTFFPWGGFMKINDDEWNKKLGDMQRLPIE